MGRPKDPNSRRSKARDRRIAAMLERMAIDGKPGDHVLQRREAFSFLYPKITQRKVGEVQRVYGEIDQLIHDGIGQLHVLGLLDGHGHEAKDLRDTGRLFAELYWLRYHETAPASASLEHHSRNTGAPPPRTRRDDLFDRLDRSVEAGTMERTALHMLLTNHYHSCQLEGWVRRLIDYELLKRGQHIERPILLDGATYGHDKYMLGCAVRGLCCLMDASLPQRHARAA